MSAARKLSQSELLSLFVVDSVQSQRDLEGYLLGVLENCTQWFRTSGASIFLATDDPEVHRLAAKFGPAVRTPDGATVTKGKGFAGKALADGQPRILIDPEVEGTTKRADIASAMIVPLRDGSAVDSVGVLNLARSHSEPLFDEADLAFAEAVASQIALAVRNAKLFAESRHLNESFKVVLANLGFAVLSLSEEGRVTQFNPEAASILAALPSAGEPWTSLIRRVEPALIQPLNLSVASALAGERHRDRFELNQRNWSITATPLPSGGCTLTLQDVTDIELAQREFDRLTRLAEVGQMTATIAHEIRNPLTGVRSAARMIKDSPELSLEFADIIEHEAVKLSLLCDEFLEFARPLRMALHPTSLTNLAASVADLIRPDFDAAGVHFDVRLDASDTEIDLDSRRVEQVLRNLLLNALQATPKGGTVILEVKRGLVSIRDTGCGMTEETVSRLFSPFFTTKTKGTGLGLSMVRKIVDAHGARIDVQSKPGVGTGFEIRFTQEQHH